MYDLTTKSLSINTSKNFIFGHFFIKELNYNFNLNLKKSINDTLSNIKVCFIFLSNLSITSFIKFIKTSLLRFLFVSK